MRIVATVCLLICLAACTVAPSRDGQLDQLGSVRIVYLNMDSNVGIDDQHLRSEIAVSMMSPLAASLLYLWNHNLDKSGKTALYQAQQTLAQLPFQGEMYTHAVQAVRNSPWASQAALIRTDRSGDWDDDLGTAARAMADGNKDAALFIAPAVYLDNTGMHMYVSFHVTVYDKIIGMSSDKPIVHRYASKSFSYTYSLKLHDPEPSFTQQKMDAKLMANMSMPGALPYWMADDGAQMRKDFEDALPKLSVELTAYLGGPHAS